MADDLDRAVADIIYRGNKDAMDRIIEGIARAKPTKPRREYAQRLGWVSSDDEYSLILRAAESRDISVNAFCNRAVVAMACATLGIDYYEFMASQNAGPVTTFHQYERQRKGKTVMKKYRRAETRHGKGAGLWRIKSLD